MNYKNDPAFIKGYNQEALDIKEKAFDCHGALYALGRYVKSLNSVDEDYITKQVSFFKERKDLKYLLIDLDNTIFDFTKAELLSLRITFEKLKIEVKEEYINTYLKINDSLWKALEKKEINKSELSRLRFVKTFDILKLDPSKALEAEKIYNSELAKHPFYLDGAEIAVKELSKKYQIFIITNGFSTIQRPRINNSSLKDYISGLYISEEIGHDKPSKAYFEYVLKAIGDRDKRHYLIVGDSVTSDIKGALNMGIESVLITKSPDPITFNLSSLAYLERALAFIPFK